MGKGLIGIFSTSPGPFVESHSHHFLQVRAVVREASFVIEYALLEFRGGEFRQGLYGLVLAGRVEEHVYLRRFLCRSVTVDAVLVPKCNEGTFANQ